MVRIDDTGGILPLYLLAFFLLLIIFCIFLIINNSHYLHRRTNPFGPNRLCFLSHNWISGTIFVIGNHKIIILDGFQIISSWLYLYYASNANDRWYRQLLNTYYTVQCDYNYFWYCLLSYTQSVITLSIIE